MSGPDSLATELAPRTGTALVRPFRVTVVSGIDQGTAAVSSRERLVIGTHPGADLVLRDPEVSPFQCEIALHDGRVELRDLDSKAGSSVNGVEVMAARLESGAIISVGGSTLRFELDAEWVEIELSHRDNFGLLVGHSQVMRVLFAALERASASDATVLLTGEPGAGKTAAAESIHRESPRCGGPFVVVNGAATARERLEQELFAPRRGALEAARGGTLFVDEIGELPLDLQVRLLRALESRALEQRASNNPARAAERDLRLIAATQRDLRVEVNAGRFLADFYRRLVAVELAMPPLRKRCDDIPLLVKHLLEKSGCLDRPEGRALLDPPSLVALAQQPWRGNVRELRDHIERTLAAGTAGSQLQTFRAARSVFEQGYLVQLLGAHGGDVVAAARAAGVDRATLYRLLARHKLR